jgi:hypothetical protein
MSLVNWEKNVDPHYKEHYYRPSIDRSTAADGVSEKWVMYGNPYIAVNETPVPPGRTSVLKDSAGLARTRRRRPACSCSGRLREMNTS